jgi:hypothetical protein
MQQPRFQKIDQFPDRETEQRQDDDAGQQLMVTQRPSIGVPDPALASDQGARHAAFF